MGEEESEAKEGEVLNEQQVRESFNKKGDDSEAIDGIAQVIAGIMMSAPIGVVVVSKRPQAALDGFSKKHDWRENKHGIVACTHCKDFQSPSNENGHCPRGKSDGEGDVVEGKGG